MSQRQVNRQTSKLGEYLVGITQSTSQATMANLQRIAKLQQRKRLESEKAIQIGMQSQEAFINKYSKQLTSTNEEFNTALTNQLRKTGKELGLAKQKAFAPGATKEERDNYTSLLTNSNKNMEGLAVLATNIENGKNNYASHGSAVQQNVALGRITKDGLESMDIPFYQSMNLSTAKDISINTKKNGNWEIAYNGGNFDVFAYNAAFSQKGETSNDFIIKEEDLLDKKIANGGVWDKEYFKKWEQSGGMMDATQEQKKTYNAETGMLTSVLIQKGVNWEEKLLKENDWLESRVNANDFGKTWDQLALGGYLKDGQNDFVGAEIGWNTFKMKMTDANRDQILANLNNKYKDADPTPDNPTNLTQVKGWTEDDYNDMQASMIDHAKKGLAKMVGTMKSTPDVVLKEVTDDNKYKQTPDGGTTYTTTAKQHAANNAALYKKTNTSLQNATSVDDITKIIRDNSGYFNVNKSADIITGKEYNTKYATQIAANNLTLADVDGIYDTSDPTKPTLLINASNVISPNNVLINGGSSLYSALGIDEVDQTLLTSGQSNLTGYVDPNMLVSQTVPTNP